MMVWWPIVRKFGPYLLIVVALGALWLHGNQTGKRKWQAKYKAEVAAHEATARTLNDTNIRWTESRMAVAICNERTADFSAEASARISRLEAALAEKPRVITQYIEAADNLDSVITSDVCTEALSQAALVLEGVTAP